MAAARVCLADNGDLGVRHCARESACQLTRLTWTTGGGWADLGSPCQLTRAARTTAGLGCDQVPVSNK